MRVAQRKVRIASLIFYNHVNTSSSSFLSLCPFSSRLPPSRCVETRGGHADTWLAAPCQTSIEAHRNCAHLFCPFPPNLSPSRQASPIAPQRALLARDMRLAPLVLPLLLALTAIAWQGIAHGSSYHASCNVNWMCPRFEMMESRHESKSVMEVLIELKADLNAELKVPLSLLN